MIRNMSFIDLIKNDCNNEDKNAYKGRNEKFEID